MTRSWHALTFLITLLIIMGVIQYLRTVFRPEVTLGEIFAILIPLVLAGIVIGWSRYRQRRPFSFKFADQPFDLSAKARMRRTYSREKRLAVGKSKLSIAVRTRIATTGDPFDIRFVERGNPPKMAQRQ